MPEYRTTKTPGVFIRHRKACPTTDRPQARCRCTPSYRGRRHSPTTGRPEWSKTYRSRDEVLTWLGAVKRGQTAITARSAAGRTLESLYTEWMAAAEAGQVASNHKGRRYSDTTLKGYKSRWKDIQAEFGARPAAGITEAEWQHWIERVAADKKLSRSSLRNLVALASTIYKWAGSRVRRDQTGVTINPLRHVELPGRPEQPRERVCTPDQADQLLAALENETERLPYALAFYAGFRRAEIARLDWSHVDLDSYRLLITKAKSDAGTNRRPPIAKQLRPLLKRAYLAAGKPKTGPVVTVDVMGTTLQKHADKAWKAAKLERLTLHECRHTYASFLMAAGYSLKEIMDYGGWADLQMVQRYVKRLGPPDETDPADRLNAYLDSTAADTA